MPKKEKFDLLRDLFEQSLKREEDRRGTFERRTTNLLGLFGALVGVFVGTLIPDFFSEAILPKIFSNKMAFIFWVTSLFLFLGSIPLIFYIMWQIKKFNTPQKYMYPDPASLIGFKKIKRIENEYLDDIRKSINFNQNIINGLGSDYIKLSHCVIITIVIFFLSSLFFLISKYLISNSGFCICLS